MTNSAGTTVLGGVLLSPQVKGKAFSETKSGADIVSQGTATYTMKGSFTTPTAFSGTASKEVKSPTKNCATKTISFKLRKKG